MRDHIVVEVKKRLDDLGAHRLWRPRMIAVDICAAHETPELKASPEYAFWHYCGYETCRDITTEVIAHVTDPAVAAEEPSAPLLPGFTHLQTHYNVRRNVDGGIAAREIVGVPIERLTSGEMLAIAGRMRAIGGALFEHADELDRYRLMREAAE